jgi:hypothetical protein
MSKRKTAIKGSSPKKKRNRRSQEKYPALKPELNLRSRYELFDQDYIDKLSDEEKAWLNKFNDEYVNTNLDRKNPENNLHNSKLLIKDCDDRSNARRRCILSRNKASGQNIYLEDIKETDANVKDFLGEVGEDLHDTSSDRKKNS